jgi:tyrosyl-tRNA synthetase
MSHGVQQEVERQLSVMRDGAVAFFGEEELKERLARALESGRPLRVKLGLDPSSPNIHIGHTVVLKKLERFQRLGHVPIFLVGDFTARIGDPSGRKKTRPALSEEQVKENAATYVEQARLVLDVDNAEIRFNSEWMDRLSSADFVRLCSHYTVARLLERDDFAKRYSTGEPISVHELLYPLAQAYDSVALRSDVELGGTDQTFNLLVAREIQASETRSASPNRQRRYTGR